MSLPNVRQSMFPYGMEKNSDGSWTLFNRRYKPVGVVSNEWTDWDDPRHKLRLKGVDRATLRKLAHDGDIGDRVYFYDDGSNPENSTHDLAVYMRKLRILIGLQSE